MTEDTEQYTVICDVPGLRQEDIEVSLAQSVLTVALPEREEAKPRQITIQSR